MKILNYALILISYICLATAVTFSTKSKSKKMLAAEEVLNSLKEFNNKYSNYGGNSGVSQDLLEKESKTLDIKFNDLLKVFTEPNFLSTNDKSK